MVPGFPINIRVHKVRTPKEADSQVFCAKALGFSGVVVLAQSFGVVACVGAAHQARL